VKTQMMAGVLYGKEHLRVEPVAVPTIGEGDLLVRVRVALTCGTDVKVFRRGYHARMIVPPAVFGHELAGDVVAAGREVKAFAPGQRVVAANSAPCEQCYFCRRDMQNLCEDLLFNNGAYAQFIRIPGRIVRQNMLQLPDHVSYADAAMVEPLACVLRGIEETGMHQGDTAVVLGSGPIGLKFVRILAARGVRVIAVGKRKSQLDTAERLGATETLNVTEAGDAAQVVRGMTERGLGADAVIEAVGTPTTWEWALKMVRPGGAVNLFGGCPHGTEVRIDPSVLHYSEITIRPTFHHTPEYIRKALAAIASGQIRAADFVTREAGLEDLPQVFETMKDRDGELKTAVIP
jgi:L-iditol 2-dehydrogenase